MTFEVKLAPEADKFLKKLDAELAERIRAKLRSLKEAPFQHLEHYNGDYYKLRIGDYRALIDMDASRKIALVRHIDHRRRIYKQ
jgi:mRNA interferase RelE/StbE